jgi:hypothetical protein
MRWAGTFDSYGTKERIERFAGDLYNVQTLGFKTAVRFRTILRFAHGGKCDTLA